MNLRIGYGEDAHALADNKKLVIGGVTIDDSPHGTLAHSDGDVLLHALADALLASFALGDIGTYYPPSNPQFKDMASSEIVTGVLAILENHLEGNCLEGKHQEGNHSEAQHVQKVWQIHNVAAVVTLDKPKLGARRAAIAARVAALLGLEPQDVGITFKTSEGLAPAHIQARVSLLISY